MKQKREGKQYKPDKKQGHHNLRDTYQKGKRHNVDILIKCSSVQERAEHSPRHF